MTPLGYFEANFKCPRCNVHRFRLDDRRDVTECVYCGYIVTMQDIEEVWAEHCDR